MIKENYGNILKQLKFFNKFIALELWFTMENLGTMEKMWYYTENYGTILKLWNFVLLWKKQCFILEKNMEL